MNPRRWDHACIRRAGRPAPREGALADPERTSRPFRKAWALACKEAGCPGKLTHHLRRTPYATWPMGMRFSRPRNVLQQIRVGL